MAHIFEDVRGEMNLAKEHYPPLCTAPELSHSTIKGLAILSMAQGICLHCRLSGQDDCWHIWQGSLWKQPVSITGPPQPLFRSSLSKALAKARATVFALPTGFSVRKREAE